MDLLRTIRASFAPSVAVAFLLSARPGFALDLVEVVKKVEHAVVRVDTSDGFGSGVVVDDRGFVFTNFHVIDGAGAATITLRSGEVVQAEGFLAIDPSRDLALLKTRKMEKPVAIPIADAAPQVGEKVAAFGNPRGFSFSTSEGIVSSVRSGAEVREIVSAEVYRALGYGPNATWIQTTAPISGGNSGGPLVNMNAQIVGLNTWHHPQGQNLNFAISAADMKGLLAKSADASVERFARLPRRARPVDPPPGNRPSGEFSVNLPNGRTFSSTIFELERSALTLGSLDSASVVVITHPNGAMYAAASHQGGVLHGVTVAQYENKQRMVYVHYAAGKRHGILKVWSEAGKPVLFAQYARGKRHGFLCFFDDGTLALLTDYRNDEPSWIQLMSGEKPLDGFSSREEAEKNEAAGGLFAKLEKIEATLKTNEVAFRKQVDRYEEEQRKALARQLGPQKRARIQARSDARSAAQDAFTRELFRRATGR
jgi:S1-C subfamily serine protease